MTTKIDRDTSDAHHRALLRSTTLVDGGRMKIDRAELRRLCETAAREVFLRDSSPHPHEESNTEIVAARTKLALESRTAITALLDALEAAEARERKLREALEEIARGDYSDPMCRVTPEGKARAALAETAP